MLSQWQSREDMIDLAVCETLNDSVHPSMIRQ